jgi:protein-disulfide isomerase
VSKSKPKPRRRPQGGASKAKPNPVLVEKPRRRVSVGLIVVVILVLVLAGGVGFQYWRSNSGVTVDNANAAEPAVITGPGTDGKGVTVGKAGAPGTIEIYLDYRCPHCKEFEDEAGTAINELVDSGAAKLIYWPMAFVNPDASPRLANAWACAADEGKARGYGDQMFADFAKTWTTDQLLELGTELGITDQSFQQCVRDNSQVKWIESIQTAADKRGVTGTPTVYVNGTKLGDDQLTADGIRTALGVS